MKNVIISVDTEVDLHKEGNEQYRGVKEGLRELENICLKNERSAILFITADCIENNPSVFKKLAEKGWDISLHGFSHKRFDEMSFFDKETEIRDSIRVWKKHLGIKPKGFRAPQHSIDDDTLDLLEKYGFEYDSSYTPMNFLQLLFFPKKFKLWFKTCFSPIKNYNIRPNLEERPSSAFVIPFVSLVVRILPIWAIKIYASILGLFYKELHMYAHSWDFIEMKESKIDRLFPHDNFIKKLDVILGWGK